MRRRGWLCASDSAALAKVDRATLFRWIAAGKVESTKVGQGRFVSVASLKKQMGPLGDGIPKTRPKGRRR